MPFVIVAVHAETGERVELALPIDVPSRQVALRVMRDLGKLVRTGETYELLIRTDRGDKLIPPNATLGDLGIRDGQQLRIKRQPRGTVSGATRAHAFLQTRNGEMLALEANNIIIGRKDAVHEGPLDLDLAPHDPGRAVSRRHACIGREGSSYYLSDLESTNGTRLNGEAVPPGKKVPLHSGDSIEFGLGLHVTFVTAEAAAARRRPS